MNEKERIAKWRARKREQASAERQTDYPMIPFPEGGKLSVKNVGYLAVHCGMAPSLIAARAGVSLADVHLGLAHYYRNQAAVDAEIRRELEFNRRDTLGDASMALPRPVFKAG
jgi:hypothetical protein